MDRKPDKPRLEESTQVARDLPWARSVGRPESRALHLVVAWHAFDASRVGHSAAITRACVLGRGPGDGNQARLEFVRQRPGSLEPTGSLNCRRLSRVHLGFAPDGPGQLSVENLGRCRLLHNGTPCDSANVQSGDVLTIEDSTVFLVEERSTLWPEATLGTRRPFEFAGPDSCGIIGESAAIWALRERLQAAAEGEAHVLIYGATGAGKELAGRAVHAWSRRAAGPLVSRNAATFPESLIDAELFGNAKNFPNVGAAERPGLIGEADGGTLLLDEVGELPAAQQAHLLRVLDNGGEYQRLGESRQRRSELRVVGLTNRRPEELKLDFLARFAERIVVVGLNERLSDIPLLMRWIFGNLAQEQPALVQRFEGVQGAGAAWQPLVEPRLVELLLRHDFVHNTRELARLLRVAIATSTERYVAVSAALERELLSKEAEGEETEGSSAGIEVGPEQISAALAQAGGSPTAAAKRLGLRNRHVLYRLMKKYGIEASVD